jgi:hypothetical protein
MRLSLAVAVWIFATGVITHAQDRAFSEHISYYDDHKQWCDENRDADKSARQICVTPKWCAIHERDDRISRLSCNPYRSYADTSRSAPVVTTASLNAGRFLNPTEVLSIKPEKPNFRDRMPGSVPRDPPTSVHQVGSTELLPADIITAKLALRAQFDIYTFPTTVVSIALSSGSSGSMTVTANEDGIGARLTKRFHLNGADVDHLLAALNRSHFWQLPALGQHFGVTDGILATVEISIPDRRNRVTDSVGDGRAVDLSVLAHAIGKLASARWKSIAAP